MAEAAQSLLDGAYQAAQRILTQPAAPRNNVIPMYPRGKRPAGFPMASNHRKLIEDGDGLFSRKITLDSFWHQCALHFMPNWAEFVTTRWLGQEYTDHLTTSYPVIVRRQLGDALGAMLRPMTLDNASPGVWFSIMTDREDVNEDQGARRWMDWAAGVMRRALYDRSSGFVKATKQADHSFVTFGQAPIYVTTSQERDRLLFLTRHLKDCAWTDDEWGKINRIHVKLKLTPDQVLGMFKGNASPKVATMAHMQLPGGNTNATSQAAQGQGTIDIRHIVMRSDDYAERDPMNRLYRQPWVCIWLDVTNNWVMEEAGYPNSQYVIPRWVQVPTSQYAVSPAVMVALPEARLMQAMTLTMLEASEKFADPPMAATQEAMRSDVALFPGGITWLDAEYDERMGEALRPIYQPTAGQNLQYGLAMRQQIMDMLNKAFYLDSLAMPPADVRNMTAFEVGQRISEWIRNAMPIFEPVETEYNAPLCEDVFEILQRTGAFGRFEDMPEILRGRDISFKFQSPLHQNSDKMKGQTFLECKAALLEAAQLDQGVLPMMDADKTLRDVLNGLGAPAAWIRSPEEMQQLQAQMQAEQQSRDALQGMVASSQASANLGQAAKGFADAHQAQQAVGQTQAAEMQP